jgi:tetratricopeptide (TPR) repeat protein
VSNNHMWLFTAVAVLCLNHSIHGQASEVESIKGELHVNSPVVLHGEVTLSDLHGGPKVAQAPFGGDGRFEFRHLPYGEYRLTVLDANQKPIHEELIAVHDQQHPIEVDVRVVAAEPAAASTVSRQELLHPATKKAFQAFLAAQKFSEAGEHEKAAEQLEKAIQLSPDYCNAWINLAAQHIFLKRYEQALQELTHASQISRPTALLLSNMAFAQFALHRFAEGTLSAREALRLDPSCVQAHYLLGSLLAQDRRTRTEGIQHLEVATRTMPAARTELERIQRDSAQVVTHP